MGTTYTKQNNSTPSGWFIKILFSFLLLAIWTFSFSVTSYAAPEKLEYAYPDISVWTTKRDANGKLKNPLVKLAKPLFEKAGIPWHAQDYPAKRMFENLRNNVSKFSMLVNAKKALNGCCLVSKEPVAVVEIRIYSRGKSPVITKREDLLDKDLITIRGYSYAGLKRYIVDNKISNNEAGSHHAAFAMLEAGRADYVLDYANPAEEVLQENPIKDIKFETMSQSKVYLILSKAYPDAENVMAKLEKIAATLNKDEFLNPPGR
ncbi:MAG: transporter substrate-binding domain-containing protein [Rhodospirillales bacterium]|nr:transporter substrate-binding domain-containing protein [Rhodospirillales bacterium]